MKERYIKLIATILIGTIIYKMPIPNGLSVNGWHMFAIFAATIIGIILKPLPLGAVSLLGMLFATFTGTINMDKEALMGFASPVSWLVVAVFLIARGFIKSQLGYRIAYKFLSILGKSTLGIGYGLTFTELLIAPMIPSNSARAGGIIYPVMRAITEALGSYPNDGSSRKIGSYLTQVVFQNNLIVSSMFLTGMAANPMAQSIAAKQGIIITWGNWAIAALVPGILSLFLIPLLLYFIYPPQVKHIPNAVDIATEKLQQMGPMSKNEIIMAMVFLGMVGLWIFGDQLGISVVTAAILGLVILLITNILNWEDVLQEKEAWNTLIWFSILVMMSGFLEKYGFITWFGQIMANQLQGVNWIISFLIAILIYFYSHYMFASNTAHVSAMYGAFLSLLIITGSPPLLSALVLGFFSNLFSSTTHYGTGAAAVYYGSGYVPIVKWWQIGFVVSVVNIFIWLGLGGLWWKFLNLW